MLEIVKKSMLDLSKGEAHIPENKRKLLSWDFDMSGGFIDAEKYMTSLGIRRDVNEFIVSSNIKKYIENEQGDALFMYVAKKRMPFWGYRSEILFGIAFRGEVFLNRLGGAEFNFLNKADLMKAEKYEISTSHYSGDEEVLTIVAEGSYFIDMFWKISNYGLSDVGYMSIKKNEQGERMMEISTSFSWADGGCF